MSYFQPEAEGKKYYLFGRDGGQKLCDEWSLDLLGQIQVKEDKSFESLHSDYLPVVGAKSVLRYFAMLILFHLLPCEYFVAA